MSTLVYMADLRHNFGRGLSTDCMPLAVGYMKAVMDRDLPEIQSQIFAYPDRLSSAIQENKPDVVMVGNYVWNEALGLHFLRMAKEANPNCLTIMGGPNISNEADRQIEFVKARPEIDVYILGEADFLAADLVRYYLEDGKSVSKLGERDIPSCVYKRPDGTFVRNAIWERRRAIDDIPSPWLTGVMDEFFDGKLAPMIETNRGCPFTCTFCVQGTRFYTKVNHFSTERLKDEIDYIAKMIHEKSPSMGTLRIADANYGMYERDVELSEHIGKAQARYGWPTFIDATTGKNRPERIVQSLEKVNGALVLYQAVQSLDENVLRNVKRSNIKLSAYEQINIYVRGRGLRSNSDLILGLPGESLQTHLTALHKILDSNINSMHCFQAMMLKGAEMEEIESREMFKFGTRYRVLPKNFGIYDEEKVFDVEEVIVETDTLPFDDYLRARMNHLTFSVFWNDNWFQDAVNLVNKFGVKNSEWLTAMLAEVEANKGEVREFLEAFLDETRNELFDTRESCVEFYSREDNFQKLLRGEIGDNLMYKYRARASFFMWPDICRTAMLGTKRLLMEKGAFADSGKFEAFWGDFCRYIEAKHASGSTADEILSDSTVVLSYDVDRWIADGMPAEIDKYLLDEPTPFIFSLTSEGKRELTAALAVWTTNLTGLTKMVTRIRIDSQVRRCYRADTFGEVAESEASDELLNVTSEQIIR